MPGMKQIILKKGQEKFIFRYGVGKEDALLDLLMKQAANPAINFDWFDAAMVSFRLNRILIAQAEYYLEERTSPPPQVIEFSNP